MGRICPGIPPSRWGGAALQSPALQISLPTPSNLHDLRRTRSTVISTIPSVTTNRNKRRGFVRGGCVFARAPSVLGDNFDRYQALPPSPRFLRLPRGVALVAVPFFCRVRFGHGLRGSSLPLPPGPVVGSEVYGSGRLVLTTRLPHRLILISLLFALRPGRVSGCTSRLGLPTEIRT